MLEAQEIAPAHAPDPAPAEAFGLAVEGHLEAGVGDDDRGDMRRQQAREGAQKPPLHVAVAQQLLPMYLLVEHQTAGENGVRPPFYETHFLRLLLTLEDCQTTMAELVDAIGPLDQWVARDHDALLAE